ncbi:FHA domain-containing protein [Cycloclasticus pugetii]|jgi:hypothetical protein|uniref:FHA domain-containing protein n=1 Tax=Cycloclasticus pugetii TaxID=34068 RepID=UPI0009208BAF|nr:FHA domain-containing protein [Cycloclasticus pugetii]SHI87987.1 Forkhead associated (FHA) domain, binds pSer, pThr, pTyr [Cycloclasticus pugetii]|tara:strand:+ start:1861 stop:2460 length:600 start_codon:yes stop_codon:yes gene_type:complete
MSNDDSTKGGFFNNPTRRVGSEVGAFATIKKGGATESLPTDTDDASQGIKSSDTNPVTRRVRPTTSNNEVASESTLTNSANRYHPEFVVGWLVVVKGPGRGMSLPLGYGLNSIGRGEEAGVKLDFGDEEISRNSHCQIAYDHKNKKFYIQHGGGQNLTYLEDQPVLSSCELNNNMTISLGSTTLKFVQLCDDAFDWELS